MFSCADGRLEVSTASRSRTVGTARRQMFVAHREVIEHETFMPTPASFSILMMYSLITS